MSYVFSPSGGIKSVQQGTIAINDPALSNTAVITSVNTAKAFVLNLGMETASTGIAQIMTRVSLTDATTVTATRGATAAGNNVTVGFVVVEFS